MACFPVSTKSFAEILLSIIISVIYPIRGIHPKDGKSTFPRNIEETSNSLSGSVTSNLSAFPQLREATIFIVVSVLLSVCH
jgi:hypothetical protein